MSDFQEWSTRGLVNFDTAEDAAEAAWDHQQAKINRMTAETEQLKVQKVGIWNRLAFFRNKCPLGCELCLKSL